ncbi:MAG: hypothetical protein P4M07_08420 [Xanthobacteraceae bacterium]|nr:hypothetical protein [Xanthobacteraceae bacterium]
MARAAASDLIRRVRRGVRARLARAVPWGRIRNLAQGAWYGVADSVPVRRLLRATGRPLRIGGMATMPSRADCLPAALASILPQVDLLYLYLDKHDAVPPALGNRRKIVPIVPADLPRLVGGDAGSPSAAGKFIATRLHDDCLFFAFDDDIVYPRDHTRRLAAALKRRRYHAVVGVHGVSFRPPHRSYTRDRTVFHFSEPLAAEREVDEIGTGTVAFRTAVFRPQFWGWRGGMLDLNLAIEAQHRGLPRIIVDRGELYLRPIDRPLDDALWTAVLRDDTAASALLRANPQLWTRPIPAAAGTAGAP